MLHAKVTLTEGTPDMHSGDRLIISEDGILEPISECGQQDVDV